MLATICIGPDDNMEQRRQDIVDAISQVDGGNGVVLLTDMFGGTPSNLAISLLEKDHVEVIAGINLPMLIKFASIRETMSLQEAVLEAKEAARKYISVASEVLGDS
jgi:PTS system mannose-specific IIA component